MCENYEFGSKSKEALRRQWFGETIRKLIFKGCEANYESMLSHSFIDKIKINFDMLSLSMKDWIGSEMRVALRLSQ